MDNKKIHNAMDALSEIFNYSTPTSSNISDDVSNLPDVPPEDAEYINHLINMLRQNHNIILSGAPGTGKTFLAKQMAKIMGAKFKFVQFHPSMDYTDFVEGLRPTPGNNEQEDGIGFRLVPGIFKSLPLHQNLWAKSGSGSSPSW